jgi:hypothetical protein
LKDRRELTEFVCRSVYPLLEKPTRTYRHFVLIATSPFRRLVLRDIHRLANALAIR